MSRPVPSPSIKGMIGLFGTTGLPFWIVIFSPSCGVGIPLNEAILPLFCARQWIRIGHTNSRFPPLSRFRRGWIRRLNQCIRQFNVIKIVLNRTRVCSCKEATMSTQELLVQIKALPLKDQMELVEALQRSF